MKKLSLDDLVKFYEERLAFLDNYPQSQGFLSALIFSNEPFNPWMLYGSKEIVELQNWENQYLDENFKTYYKDMGVNIDAQNQNNKNITHWVKSLFEHFSKPDEKIENVHLPFSLEDHKMAFMKALKETYPHENIHYSVTRGSERILSYTISNGKNGYSQFCENIEEISHINNGLTFFFNSLKDSYDNAPLENPSILSKEINMETLREQAIYIRRALSEGKLLISDKETQNALDNLMKKLESPYETAYDKYLGEKKTTGSRDHFRENTEKIIENENIPAKEDYGYNLNLKNNGFI